MAFLKRLKAALTKIPNTGAPGKVRKPVKRRRFSTSDANRLHEMEEVIKRAEVRLDVPVKRFEDSGQLEKHPHHGLFVGSRNAIKVGLRELPTLPDKEYEERLTTVYALVGQLERNARLSDDRVQ